MFFTIKKKKKKRCQAIVWKSYAAGSECFGASLDTWPRHTTRGKSEQLSGLTCHVKGHSVIFPVLQEVFRIVEATAFEPLRDVRNPFGRVHDLQRTTANRDTHVRESNTRYLEAIPRHSRPANSPAQGITRSLYRLNADLAQRLETENRNECRTEM